MCSYTGDAGFGVFVSANSIEVGAPEPLLDFLAIVVVALRGREDIEGVIQFHIEGKIFIVREGKFRCKSAEADCSKEFCCEIDEMHDTSRYITELEENRLREMTKHRAERFIEIESARVSSAVVDPDEHFPAWSKGFWQSNESFLGFGEVVEDAD